MELSLVAVILEEDASTSTFCHTFLICVWTTGEVFPSSLSLVHFNGSEALFLINNTCSLRTSSYPSHIHSGFPQIITCLMVLGMSLCSGFPYEGLWPGCVSQINHLLPRLLFIMLFYHSNINLTKTGVVRLIWEYPKNKISGKKNTIMCHHP